MEDIFHSISAALSRAVNPSLPPTETDVATSPWEMWLLFALVRHTQRQRWVADIFEKRLGGDLAAISARGWMGHPSVENSALVPGLTEWEYRLHGRGCCVTNRVSGECIDVDFYDESPEWIDVYFFRDFLASLRQPRFVERRIIALHPTLDTISLTFDRLVELGLVVRRADSHVMRVAVDCAEWLQQLDELDTLADNQDVCVRIGATFGDWLLVRENSGSFNADDVSRRGTALIDQRRARLRELFVQAETRRVAMLALVDLGGETAKAAIEAALQDGPGAIGICAIDALDRKQNEDWSNSVLGLLRRTNPNGDIPEPSLWLHCARYLLRHDGSNAEVLGGLGRMHERELGEAAILALEFGPQIALKLFRRALRSSIPNDRNVAAAALAILDQPWSREELLSLLDESDDQEATAECRAALCALADVRLHARVAEWERLNPHEPEGSAYITISEMALRTRNQWMQYEMQRLHDLVLPLRSRLQ
jgi:hypothetical protein